MGLVIIVVLVAGVLIIKNIQNKKAASLPTPTPSIESRVTQKFGNITIPSNADKADLNDVSGGQGIGEAAKTYENGKYTITVLADVPEPSAGYFYQAWIVKGLTYTSIGKLRVAKGGYLVDFSVNKDYRDSTKVVVTLEKVFDNTPEKTILEGSF